MKRNRVTPVIKCDYCGATDEAWGPLKAWRRATGWRRINRQDVCLHCVSRAVRDIRKADRAFQEKLYCDMQRKREVAAVLLGVAERREAEHRRREELGPEPPPGTLAWVAYRRALCE